MKQDTYILAKNSEKIFSGLGGLTCDQQLQTDIDAGLTRQTNSKTNDAGLTFLRYSGSPAFLVLIMKM
jgi:hypothetical protein